MAAAPLFGDTNMAAVTSRENTLYVKIKISSDGRATRAEIIIFFSLNMEISEVAKYD